MTNPSVWAKLWSMSAPSELTKSSRISVVVAEAAQYTTWSLTPRTALQESTAILIVSSRGTVRGSSR